MKRKTKTIDPKIKKELENGTYHMKYRDFDIDIISKIFDLGTTKIPVPGLSASIYHDEGKDGQGNKIISDGQIYNEYRKTHKSSACGKHKTQINSK